MDQHQDFIRIIADNMTAGLLFLDAEQRTIYVNPAWEKMTGYALDEMLGQIAHDLVHHSYPDGRAFPFNECPIDQALPLFKPLYDWENVFVHKDGHFYNVLCNAQPIYKNGEPIGTVVEVRDVTRQKQIEDSLRASEERYQALYHWERQARRIVETLREPGDLAHSLTTLVREVGSILKADRCFVLQFNDENQPVPVAFEYRKDESIEPFLGKIPPWEHCSYLRRTACHEFVAARDALSDTLITANPVWEAFAHEHGIRGVIASPILYQEKILSILVVHTLTPRDWNEQELALARTVSSQVAISIYQALSAAFYEQAQVARSEAEALKDDFKRKYEWERHLRETIQKLREFLEPDQIFPVLAEQVGRNLGLDRMFVIEFRNGDPLPVRYEYLGSPVVESFIGFTPPWYDCPYFEMCRSKQPVFVDDVQRCTITTNDWQNWFEARRVSAYAAIPIFYENEVLNTMVLHHGQTRRWHEAERSFLIMVAEQLAIALYQARVKAELEAVSKRKSEFVAMMSHELRTPLNSILGYSRMLETGMAGPLNKKQRQFAENVGISGRHLLSIINDLLDISKIEAGKMQISPQWLALQPLVAEIQSMMMDLANKKQVRLEFHVPRDLDGIYADPGRLRQILLNLISNGIKFNNPGGKVRVRLFQSAHELVGVIQDTGIGIPAHKLPELFKKFQQVDASASRAQSGTGLGLALTKDLLEMHGGRISVDSREGVGTTFTFHLPMGVPSPAMRPLQMTGGAA